MQGLREVRRFQASVGLLLSRTAGCCGAKKGIQQRASRETLVKWLSVTAFSKAHCSQESEGICVWKGLECFLWRHFVEYKKDGGTTDDFWKGDLKCLMMLPWISSGCREAWLPTSRSYISLVHQSARTPSILFGRWRLVLVFRSHHH